MTRGKKVEGNRETITKNVLELLCRGWTLQEISLEFYYSYPFITQLLYRLRQQTDCRTTYQLVAKYCGYSQEET